MELDIDASLLEGRIDQGQLPFYVERAEQLVARQFHELFDGECADAWPYFVQSNLPGVLEGLITGALPLTDQPVLV